MKWARRSNAPAAAPWGAALVALLAGPFARADHPRPGKAEIRRRLEEVFAGPEFSASGLNWERWLADLFVRFFGWLGGLRAASPVLFWVILLGCCALLVLLVGHITWTVRRVFAARPRRRGEEAEAADRRQRLSLAYREEARRAADGGEFTEAIRFLFLSLVYRFDESGRVNFRRAYTNREYLALFADRPEVGSGLAVFVDTLDDYWYAQRPTDRGRYETCLALYEGLQ